MKKVISWIVWLFVVAEGWDWAFGPTSGLGRKVTFVIAVIALGLFLIGWSVEDSEDERKRKERDKWQGTGKVAQSKPVESSSNTYSGEYAESSSGSTNYNSISMDTNIIKTHQSAHPALDNQFFTRTAKYWKVNPIGHPGINGTPGVGLDSSDFSNGRVKAGQAGEKELAQMMCYLGIASENVQTYWSLRLPYSDLDTDVDAIVSYNNNIILIDAKQYKAGTDLKYEYSGEPNVINVRNTRTGEVIKRYTFSRSMEMALEKYSQMFPTAHIEGAVVLCPTRNGIAATDANLGICNGKLAVTQSWTYLQDLKADIDKTNGRTNPEYDRELRTLLKS